MPISFPVSMMVPMISVNLSGCAKMAADDGIHTIVATPYMLKGIYNFSKKDVLKKVEELRDLGTSFSFPVSPKAQ